MGKTPLAAASLLAGLALGAGLAIALARGNVPHADAADAGAGTAAVDVPELSVGSCLAMDAARDLGLLTAAEVDFVLERAAWTLARTPGLSSDADVADTVSACDDLMTALRL